jgi:type II secretory pathway pseudopilin PulG
MRKSVRNFTLIEMVAVVAMILLLAGFVIWKVGKIPSYAQLEGAANGIKGVCAEASSMSLIQGKTIKVGFNSENKTFSISSSGENTLLNRRFMSYKLSDDIEIESNATDEEDSSFIFFPDGSGSGPEISLRLKGHLIAMRISPLTGTLLTEEKED